MPRARRWPLSPLCQLLFQLSRDVGSLDTCGRRRGAARGRRLEPHEASELSQRRVDGVAARPDLVEGRDELLGVSARVVGLGQLAAGRAEGRVIALEVVA